MKTRMLWVSLLTLVVILAMPVAAAAGGQRDGQVVLGGNYTLASGETLTGDLLVMGGNATLMVDSRVTGSVLVMGGNLEADGRIEGDVGIVGGNVRLGEHAVVVGDVMTIGGSFDRAAGAVVQGEVVSGTRLSLPIVRGPFVGPGVTALRDWRWTLSPVVEALWMVVRSFLLAALAVLVVMFWPEATQRTARAAIEQPVIAGAVGLLTVIAVPALLVLLAITICLIPISLLGFLLFGLSVAFGVIALGLEVGRRMGEAFQRAFHPAAAAGLGTLLLALVVGGIGLIPCVGWIAPTLTAALGVGAVVLTRFGSRTYTAAGPSLPPPAEPPASA